MINKYMPDYLIDRNNVISYLIFVAFFSIIFINIFTPFQGAWYNTENASRYDLFLFTVFLVLGGVVVLGLSRWLMSFIHRKYGITIVQYFSWIVLEVVLIATCYTCGCYFSPKDTRPFSEIFTRAVLYVPLIMLIPTIITYLYLGIKERDKTIDSLLALKNDTPDDLIESNAGGKSTESIESVDIINFFDEKKELKLSVKTEYIYYVEAFDNYVQIYYSTKDEIARFTLRSSMKKQEELLTPHGFVRCHRSYIVNFAKVTLLRKDKDGPYLELGNKDIPEIPVSKTYLDKVTSHLTYPR